MVALGTFFAFEAGGGGIIGKRLKVDIQPIECGALYAFVAHLKIYLAIVFTGKVDAE